MPVLCEITIGNLLDQPVEVIVNAWNRNIIPWWLLRPHGVSGAIKRRAGTAPFRELQTHGPLTLGQAVLTGAGQLPYKGIIHVASISLWGRSTVEVFRTAVQNVLVLAQDKSFASIAFPVLGSGSGGVDERTALAVMTDACHTCLYHGQVRIVRYRSKQSPG
jgi:O-acetyl-ADP-ribose deacetylase (regulator of RNase III)